MDSPVKKLLSQVNQLNHRLKCVGLKPLNHALAVLHNTNPRCEPVSTLANEMVHDPYRLTYLRAKKPINKPKPLILGADGLPFK